MNFKVLETGMGRLKGQCHEIFCVKLFSWIFFPQAQDNSNSSVFAFFSSSFSYSYLSLFFPCAQYPFPLAFLSSTSPLSTFLPSLSFLSFNFSCSVSFPFPLFLLLSPLFKFSFFTVSPVLQPFFTLPDYIFPSSSLLNLPFPCPQTSKPPYPSLQYRQTRPGEAQALVNRYVQVPHT